MKAGWTASITHTDDRPVNLGAAYNNAYRAAPIIPSLVDGKYGNTSLYQNVGNPVTGAVNIYGAGAATYNEPGRTYFMSLNTQF